MAVDYIPFKELSYEDQFKITNEGLPEKLEAIEQRKGLDFIALSTHPTIVEALNKVGYEATEKNAGVMYSRYGFERTYPELAEKVAAHERWLDDLPDGVRLEVTDDFKLVDMAHCQYNLSGAKIHGDASACILSGNILHNVEFDCDLTGAFIYGSDLSMSDFSNARTDGMIIRNSKTVHCKALPEDGQKHCVIKDNYTTDDYNKDVAAKHEASYEQSLQASTRTSLREAGKQAQAASEALSAQQKAQSAPAVSQAR